MRLKLVFEDDLNSEFSKSWYYVHESAKLVSDISYSDFSLKTIAPSGVVLLMEDFVLPPNQTLAILSEGNTITVRKRGTHQANNNDKKRKSQEDTKGDVLSNKRLKTDDNKQTKKPKKVDKDDKIGKGPKNKATTKGGDKQVKKQEESKEKPSKTVITNKPKVDNTKAKTDKTNTTEKIDNKGKKGKNTSRPTRKKMDSESESSSSSSEAASSSSGSTEASDSDSSDSDSSNSSNSSDSDSKSAPPPAKKPKQETKPKKLVPTKPTTTNNHDGISKPITKSGNTKSGDTKPGNTKTESTKTSNVKTNNKITKLDTPSSQAITPEHVDGKHLFFDAEYSTPTQQTPSKTTASPHSTASTPFISPKTTNYNNKEATSNNYDNYNDANDNNYKNYNYNNDNGYYNNNRNRSNRYNNNNRNNRYDRGSRDTGWDKAMAEGDVLRNVSFILTNDGTPMPSRAMQKFLRSIGTTKPERNYEQLCPLSGTPKVSDKIAFKMLELVDLAPIVSDFKEGTIENFDVATQQIVIRLDPAFVPSPQPLTESGEYGDEYYGYDDSVVYEEPSDQVETNFAELMDVKLLVRDGKEVPKTFFGSSSVSAATPSGSGANFGSASISGSTSTPAASPSKPLPAPILVPSPTPAASLPSSNPSSTTPSPKNNTREPEKRRRRAGLSGLLVTLQKEATKENTSTTDSSGS